ncbi:hypothetical protein LXL04_021860 [Taraxacum kok-saghyz]
MTVNNNVMKNKTFSVFDMRMSFMCGQRFAVNNCYCLVREDGFYFAKDDRVFPDGWQFIKIIVFTLHIMNLIIKHRFLIIVLFNLLVLIGGGYVFPKAGNRKRSNYLDLYAVYITNGDIDNLMAHCKSKDDDIGDKKLTPNQYFHWIFRQNFLLTTLFACTFRSMTPDNKELKHATFNVFDIQLSILCGDEYSINRCYWLVRNDGFYFSRDDDKTFPDGWIYFTSSLRVLSRYFAQTRGDTFYFTNIMSFTTKHYSFIIIFINFLFLTLGVNVHSDVENHKAFQLLNRFTVSIIDAEVNYLMVHCKSDDNDLGDRQLVHGQRFNWSFRMNFLFTTHFFCTFRSMTPDFSTELKSITFDVFQLYISTRCGERGQGSVKKCYWLVKNDGFYLSMDNNAIPGDWKLMHSPIEYLYGKSNQTGRGTWGPKPDEWGPIESLPPKQNKEYLASIDVGENGAPTIIAEAELNN